MMDYTVLKALYDSDPANSGRTPQEVAEWMMEVLDVEQKLPLDELITMLDDMEVLATIQSKAALAERKIASGDQQNQPSASEAACLDAALFMRTAVQYGRTTANFSKRRHLDRVTGLQLSGVITRSQKDNIAALPPIVETRRFQEPVAPEDIEYIRREF